MTTKFKVIAGFFLMICCAVAIALLGYSSLREVSNTFGEYRRYARLDTNLSDISSSINKGIGDVLHFVDSHDPKFVQATHVSLDGAAKIVDSALSLVRNPAQQEDLGKINQGIRQLKSLVSGLERDYLDNNKQYMDTVRPSISAMRERLFDLSARSHQVGNLEALKHVAILFGYFSRVTGATGRFSESLDVKDMEVIKAALSDMDKTMVDLGATVQSEEGKKYLQLVNSNVASLNSASRAMEARGEAIRRNMAEAFAFIDRLRDMSDQLSKYVTKNLEIFGADARKKVETSQTNLVVTSLVCVALGLLLALFIVWGLVKVLREVSSFAEAVAHGRFDHHINVKEKGEIGGMVAAVEKIPLVLDSVVHQASALSSGILGGRFRDRLNQSDFDGDFSELAHAINSVGDAYTGVIDSFPLPLMACDKKNNIVFLNTAAQGALGGNHINSRCSQHLRAPECNTNSCLGDCAMRNNAPVVGETEIHPGGKRMDIAVTALPLRDERNQSIGYIEIITDITAIKERQNVVLQVGRDAAEIADRVAAASEELSAQVEQVSLGAETQRTRVESTASAMSEMNSTVTEVAKNAGQAAEQSEGTRVKAEGGAGLVNKVVEAINQVNHVAVSMQGNMEGLGKQAEKIGGVMNVISDIADQTNLLALNAAIEAARAGDAGRGFAVVADEVRKLAEKTMLATQEVGENIRSIQHSARTNIDEMGRAVNGITEATGLADSSGMALREILQLASSNSTVVASIATSAEQQSAAAEEIHVALEEINKVVNETTDGMVQSSRAVQDLARMAQELRRVMDPLK